MGIKDNQTFLDLGSGIGNVVFHVAAETRAKAYGVELLDIPARFARSQLLEFRNRLKLFGRDPPSIHLSRGDFLEEQKVHKVIERADIVRLLHIT